MNKVANRGERAQMHVSITEYLAKQRRGHRFGGTTGTVHVAQPRNVDRKVVVGRVPGKQGFGRDLARGVNRARPERRVFVGQCEVHLTPIEYKLLTTLVRNAGKVLTHRYLLHEVWGPGHAQETHYLRVFMANLRRKIEADPAQPQYLLTEQGVGYRLAAD